MSKKKLKTYRVRLFGELPCSAHVEVEAENEEQAKERAEENWQKANWDGADYTVPEGATVEAVEAEEI